MLQITHGIYAAKGSHVICVFPYASQTSYKKNRGEKNIPSNFQHNSIERYDQEVDVSHTQNLTLVEQLRKRFESYSVGLVSCLLWGMSGNGKTALAINYLNAYFDQYEIILWFNAKLSLKEQFIHVAREIFKVYFSHESEESEIVKFVYASLAARNDKWIVVFDGAGLPESIQIYLPSPDDYAQASAHCLIISEHNNYVAHKFHVRSFSDQELALIQKKFFSKVEEADYRNLVIALGGHPYALMKAYEYFSNNPSTTIDEFLGMLKPTFDLLSNILNGLSISVNHFLSATSALSVLHQHVVRSVLQGLACFSLSDIPVVLVLEIIEVVLETESVPSEFKEEMKKYVIDELGKSSLVNCLLEKNPIPHQIFMFHQLMHKTFQLQQYVFFPIANIRLILLKTFNQVFNYDYTEPTRRPSIYLNQLEAFLRSHQFESDEEKKYLLKLYVKLGNYYHYEVRNNKVAKRYYEEAYALIKAGLEVDPEDKTDILYHLGGILSQSKKNKDTDAQGMVMYADELLGDPPYELNSVSRCFAYELYAVAVLYSRWDYVFAQDKYQACLNYLCAQNTLQIKHISYALSCIEQRMGVLCYVQKKYREAIPHFEAVLGYKSQCDIFLCSTPPELYQLDNPNVEAYFFVQEQSSHEVKLSRLFYWNPKEKKIHIIDDHDIKNPEALESTMDSIRAAGKTKAHLNYSQVDTWIAAQGKTHKVHPETVVACWNMGECYFMCDDFKSAEYFFYYSDEMAMQIYGEDSISHLKLNYCLLKCESALGKTEDAQKRYDSIHRKLTREPLPHWIKEKDPLSQLSVFEIVTCAGDLETFRILARYFMGVRKEILLFAAQHGQQAIVEFLLSENADYIRAVDEHDQSILFYAALGNQEQLTKWLCDGKKVTDDERNKHQETAFLVAARSGALEVMKVLYQYRPSCLSDRDVVGNTALLLAAAYGHLSVLDWLLDKKDLKSDVTEHNLAGVTIALLAEQIKSQRGNATIVKWLKDNNWLPEEVCQDRQASSNNVCVL